MAVRWHFIEFTALFEQPDKTQLLHTIHLLWISTVKRCVEQNKLYGVWVCKPKYANACGTESDIKNSVHRRCLRKTTEENTWKSEDFGVLAKLGIEEMLLGPFSAYWQEMKLWGMTVVLAGNGIMGNDSGTGRKWNYGEWQWYWQEMKLWGMTVVLAGN